jgi:large subunit ribosomal protein L21
VLGSLTGILDMYAIIKTGGKQYRVEKDTVLSIEKLSGDKGASVTFDKVLMGSGDDKLQVGSPLLKGASVKGEILDQYKGEKVIAFKKRRRHGYQRTRGHRQNLTQVKITDIKLG